MDYPSSTTSILVQPLRQRLQLDGTYIEILRGGTPATHEIGGKPSPTT